MYKLGPLKYLRKLQSKPKQQVQYEPLETILKDKTLSELFLSWTTQNLCSENLLFYYDAEQYKAIRDPDLLKVEADRIYIKYIRERASAWVNIDYDCRILIEAELENPSPTTFDDAQFMVLDLIKYDLYLKFMDSDIYRNFKGLPSVHKFPQERRNPHIAEVPHLTYDQISTLSKCLSDPLALDEFLKFAFAEFSDATVQFYVDAEHYETFPSFELACNIYNKYLEDLSDDEVDVDAKTKNHIWHQIQMGLSPPDLFTKLKSQMYGVMAQDNFLRFQNHIINSLSVI